MNIAGISDIGLVRQQNQDNYAIITNKNGDVLAMVCDGIGGAKSGDVASLYAVRYVSEQFSKTEGFESKDVASKWFDKVLRDTNDLIFTKTTSSKDYQGMGTTFVGALLVDDKILIANVGDSRAYGLDNENNFKQITEDHSLVTELVSKGEITLDESLHHPQRNVLTNALGVVGNLRVDIFEVTTEVEMLLLCTDGLSGYVNSDLIKKIITCDSLSLNKKLEKLVDAANNAGGFDNTTIIIGDRRGGSND